ncbi:MAG: hypothetical protein QOF72_1160 [Blastocatellia bacterium]|nr:hypothetical protein [Blastocatellia bacterium]
MISIEAAALKHFCPDGFYQVFVRFDFVWSFNLIQNDYFVFLGKQIYSDHFLMGGNIHVSDKSKIKTSNSSLPGQVPLRGCRPPSDPSWISSLA